MIKALKEKWNSGSITLINLISWGLGLATFAGSITYASYASTQRDVVDLKVQQATLTEKVTNIEKQTTLLVDKLINKK